MFLLSNEDYIFYATFRLKHSLPQSVVTQVDKIKSCHIFSLIDKHNEPLNFKFRSKNTIKLGFNEQNGTMFVIDVNVL